MISRTIAALAATVLLAAPGAVAAQTSGSPPVSGQSGAASGTSTQGAIEDEIRTQLLAMGYTEVGPVEESGAGIYETDAKRDGQAVKLRIDAKKGEVRERKG